MIQIIVFLISIIYAHSFCTYNRLPDYKIPKWAKKQNNTIAYEIPDWVHTEVYNYNKPNNILQ